MENGFTPQEQEAKDSLVDAWNCFISLDPQRPDDDDIVQFRFAIHTCQKILGALVLRREYPEEWNTTIKPL